MVKFTNEKKSSLTRLFDFVVYVLDYIYREMASIPKDFLTEIHLRFFRYNKNPNKKIFGYWDFNQRLSRLGDFITFLGNLNVLRHEFNLHKKNKKNIDLCFIEDENHYNAKQLRFSKSYNFKKNIKLATLINTYVDSVFVFKSNAEFERFYQQNRRRYIRWPPTVSSSNAYDCQQMERFYKKNKFIPPLTLPVEILSQIYSFYETYVYPSLPIIFNIRNNSDRGDIRNSNFSETKRFLKHYEKNKKYKFIIICNRTEIPEDFRELSNVIFSKDHFEGVEYDLALIKSSYLSIFPGSGMACMAWHGDVPFIQHEGMIGQNSHRGGPRKGKSLEYFRKYQRFYGKYETYELLVSSFEGLVKYLKENNINNNLKNKIKDTKKYEAKF